jgi:rubredoxin
MESAFVSAALGRSLPVFVSKTYVCKLPARTRCVTRRVAAFYMCEESAPAPQLTSEDPAEKERLEKQKEIERLRAAEKFIQIDEGKFECPGCSYIYDPAKGEFLSGIKGGTAFADLPDNFYCPSCKTPKSVFFPVRKTIAGFAENQQYGFGTNSMTSGQKNSLIFGGLFLAFLLLLSGYALN